MVDQRGSAPRPWAVGQADWACGGAELLTDVCVCVCDISRCWRAFMGVGSKSPGEQPLHLAGALCRKKGR